MASSFKCDPYHVIKRYDALRRSPYWQTLAPSLKQRIVRAYQRYRHWYARLFRIIYAGCTLWDAYGCPSTKSKKYKKFATDLARLQRLGNRAGHNEQTAFDELVAALKEVRKEVEGL